MPDNPSTQSPQFNTAEYQSNAGEVCGVCKYAVGQTFYRANHQIICGRCADNLRRQNPSDSHAAFVRAIVFGSVGALVGMALYAGFVIATGLSIGYLAIAVGWIIGEAMKKGSGGIGGRRYQIVAVLLTYASVSIAYVPIMLHFRNKAVSVMDNLGQLIVWGLASPFLRLAAGPSAILGLIILGVGMRFAWKIMEGKGLVISGPYRSSRAASA